MIGTLEGVTNLAMEDVVGSLDDVHSPVLIVDELEEEPVYAVAEMLADAGHEVLILTRRSHIGRRVPHVSLLGVNRRLDERRVEVRTGLVPDGVEDGMLIARHGLSGRPRRLGVFATAVWAGPHRAAPVLGGGAPRHVVVGDASSPRPLVAIVAQAHRVGRSLHELAPDLAGDAISVDGSVDT